MSDINGSGYGSAHDWEYRGSSPFKTSYYRCRKCPAGFQHNYDDVPNIFEAMKRANIPETCAMTPPTPSEALADKELLAFINATPVVLSLLYDLNLMPEQVKEGSLEHLNMLLIASHFNEALRAHPPEGMRPNREELIDRIFAAYGITDYPMNRKMLRELLDRAAASSEGKD